jgi:hypothetical protein
MRLRVDSGERFYGVNAYLARYERLGRRKRPQRTGARHNTQSAVVKDEIRKRDEQEPRHSFEPCSRVRSVVMRSGVWDTPTVLPRWLQLDLDNWSCLSANPAAGGQTSLAALKPKLGMR